MIITTGIECPNCGRSDKVEKVSEIVLDGFSTNIQEGAEATEWAGQTYYIFYKERPPTGALISNKQGFFKDVSYNWNIIPRGRITISPLADRLLPKIEKPDVPPDFALWIGWRFILIWPIVKLIRRMNNWIYRNALIKYEQKRRNQSQAEAKWQHLFYCYRCEGVFDGESSFIPVDQLNSYLFDFDPER